MHTSRYRENLHSYYHLSHARLALIIPRVISMLQGRVWDEDSLLEMCSLDDVTTIKINLFPSQLIPDYIFLFRYFCKSGYEVDISSTDVISSSTSQNNIVMWVVLYEMKIP